VDKEVLKCAFTVSQRRVRDLDDLIDDPDAFQQIVTDEDWRILGADEMTAEGLAEKKHQQWIAKQCGQPYKRKVKKKVKKFVVQPIDDEGDCQEQEELKEAIEEEEVDEQTLRDRKICQKSSEFKAIWELCNQIKEKFP
jgi:transcriptional regulator of acetoin/glycerol metabolism